MTAMTLLRAMSDISPQDIEAALCAGGQTAATGTASPVTGEGRSIGGVVGSGIPAVPPHVRLHLGGWAAAAACLLLTAGAILHFHQSESGLVLAPSVPDQIIEITGTETSGTTTGTTATVPSPTGTAAQHTAKQTETVTVIAEGHADGTEPAPAPQDEPAQNTAPTDTEPAKSPETTTHTAAVTYAEEVPVLVAMADDAGLLTHENGSTFADGECVWELVTARDAIDSYLNGEQPVVTLGSGEKSDEVTAQIMQSPEMLRIRWQSCEAKWESYGIQYANLDGNGVLHLHVAMYSAGDPQPEPDWVYETALLWEAGTLPPVSAVDLQLSFYDDSEGGIAEWLAYIASLLDDVNIHID